MVNTTTTTTTLVARATSNNKLKAFIRFDGTGRLIAGSLILRRNKPTVGDWEEIPASVCCNYSTTTSTTTQILD